MMVFHYIIERLYIFFLLNIKTIKYCFLQLELHKLVSFVSEIEVKKYETN